MTEAFEDVREQANSRYYSYVQKHLSCRNYRNKPPEVVEPDMTVQVDTSTPVVRLTKKGLRRKRQITNLWEMGGGKTMAVAFRAQVRGYERSLFITPPSVVDDLLKDLDKWGLSLQRLTDAGISRIQAQKRARSAFFRRRKDAKAQLASVQRKPERLEEYLTAKVPLDLDGQDRTDKLDLTCQVYNRFRAKAKELEAVLEEFDRRDRLIQEKACKCRHLRNLCDIEVKGQRSLSSSVALLVKVVTSRCSGATSPARAR